VAGPPKAGAENGPTKALLLQSGGGLVGIIVKPGEDVKQRSIETKEIFQ
jgi:hypothetical protein